MKKKNAKESITRYVEYDLTDKNEVITQSIEPYLSQNTFIINGASPQVKDIETLHIYISQQSSEKIFESEKIERERISRNSDNVFIGFGPTKYGSVVKHSSDITREMFFEAKSQILESKKGVSKTSTVSKRINNKVFIVHGHDDGMKDSVARFITTIGLTPIILHEQANNGKTIIEKFEKNSDVGFAIVLYTPCDVGSKAGSEDQKPRARQNVVFEHGYFIGKLGREKVVALHRDNVEIPSDIQGMLYISFDSKSWKFELAKEMKEVGFKIDMNDI